MIPPNDFCQDLQVFFALRIAENRHNVSLNITRHMNPMKQFQNKFSVFFGQLDLKPINVFIFGRLTAKMRPTGIPRGQKTIYGLRSIGNNPAVWL